jgi:carbon-monoxide dehydrogenase large subunit
MTGFGIGASVKRREDVRLLTREGRYADDWNAPGQAYAAFVRSPRAHADVIAIDAAPARAAAGVLGVFTGRDLIAGGVGAIPTLIAERTRRADRPPCNPCADLTRWRGRQPRRS